MIRFQSFLSSSSGNCTFITDGTTHLLVDCGAGGRYIAECMRRIGVLPEDVSGILITHEHRDHIAGAGVVSRKFDIPVYATAKTWQAMEGVLGTIAPKNHKITEANMSIKSLKVQSFPIPHDAAQPVGYSFLTDDEKLTIATDIGYITDAVLNGLKGSTSVIVEANHDVQMLQNGRYPYPLKKRIAGDKGHLSNQRCGELCAQLVKMGTTDFWLGHLSAENNTPTLAYETVTSILRSQNFQVGNGINVNVLPRYWIES